MTIRNDPVFHAVISSRVRQLLPAGPYLAASRRVRQPERTLRSWEMHRARSGKGRRRATARKTSRLSTVSF